ncbi:MAG TPA: hypothetical protein PKN13_09705 [Accumulibacter sp.]|nr:hypothetical protein [Accumulibacter sp.]HMW18340.1 hypothetical protein [Accumulibacter sp.]HMX21681.1 hypothetical protein [Accumulibacter sp.]HMY06677.1 hypothetical protein [Accumulibacter sp.]HNC18393.1 hypothetical protein [Accumulibacter sp.]
MILSLVSPRLAQAIDLLDGDVQLHGFLMQSLVSTSDNNFLGKTDDRLGTDFREFGINSSWRLTSELQLSAGMLSHRAGGTDHGHLRLDYGLADWTTHSSESGRAGIRLGRVKAAYGLYNTTRDVPFTRPGIILPQSIYFERTRNLTVSADGGEIYLERYGDDGLLSASFALGLPQADTEAAKVALVGMAPTGKLKSHLAPDFQLLYEATGGRYRLALTATQLRLHYRPGPGDPLQAGTFELTPLVFSAQYNAEDWSLTSEYALRKTSSTNFGPAFYNGRATGESYYIQGTYRFAPHWEALLRYDAYYANRNDRHGHDFAASTGHPSFTRYARDWTAGVRYDVTPSFMLRAEVHHIDGTGFLAAQDNPKPAALQQRWNIYLLLASFRF